jgi:hypothetical protein
MKKDMHKLQIVSVADRKLWAAAHNISINAIITEAIRIIRDENYEYSVSDCYIYSNIVQEAQDIRFRDFEVVALDDMIEFRSKIAAQHPESLTEELEDLGLKDLNNLVDEQQYADRRYQMGWWDEYKSSVHDKCLSLLSASTEMPAVRTESISAQLELIPSAITQWVSSLSSDEIEIRFIYKLYSKINVQLARLISRRQTVVQQQLLHDLISVKTEIEAILDKSDSITQEIWLEQQF